MADKTWTAVDLELGALKINRNDSIVHIEQRYQFLDISDEILSDIAGGRYVNDIALGDLPIDIASALQTINTWLKDQCLIQEGMND